MPELSIIKIFAQIAIRIIVWGLIFGATSNVIHAQQAQTKLAIVQDSYIEESFPYATPWDNRNLYLGYDVLYLKGQTTVFLHYDMAQLSSLGIKAVDIENATLHLTKYLDESSIPMQVTVHRPISSWSETTLSWSNSPQLSESISENTYGRAEQLTIDVTQLIKADFMSGNSNGLVLKSALPSSLASIFWSNSCAVAPFPPVCINGQPYIDLTYHLNQPPAPVTLQLPSEAQIFNTANIEFSWQTTIDPEGDIVTYQLEIDNDPSFSSPENIHSLNATLHSTLLANDGVYYWRVKATDQHITNNSSYSQVRQFILDTKAPDAPLFTDLKPIYFIDSINIAVIEDESEQYPLITQLEISKSPAFTNAQAYISSDSNFNLNELESTKYFIRARTTDQANNTSTYSPTRGVIVDLEPPVINNLTLSEKFISPNNSPNTKDLTLLNFDLGDLSFEKWLVQIFFQDGETISVHDGDTPKDSIQVGNKQMREGEYFISISATDGAKRTMRAPLLSFLIDNTSPAKTSFASPSHPLTKDSIASVTITASENEATCALIINGNQTDVFKSTSFYKQFALAIEGTNPIITQCTDRAGNVAESQFSITRDTIAPHPPQLIVESSGEGILVDIISNDSTQVELFHSNSALGKFSPPYNKLVAVKDWIAGQRYSFHAFSFDKAGNRSISSQPAEVIGLALKDFQIGGILEPGYTYPPKLKNSKCHIKYNLTTKRLKDIDCIFAAPSINHTFHRKYHETGYWIVVYGTLNRNIDIDIEYTECHGNALEKLFSSIYCKERVKEIKNSSLKSIGRLTPHIAGKDLYQYILNESSNGQFNLIISSGNDKSRQPIKLAQEYTFTMHLGQQWVDRSLRSGYSNQLLIAQALIEQKNQKYFRFPFQSTIGATQWHGNTAYATPHTGIDFGAVRQPAISMADGYIRSMGWDNYYGQCLSGGNIMRVEHDNGMHTVLMHMQKFAKADGSTWKVNDRVLKGDQLGITGNTGAYNCQPLGYHLHLELRKGRLQSTHIDPVPYIQYNWELVPTLDWQKYPGRLTGDNPHPGK